MIYQTDAQDALTISADTVDRLQSVQHIDYTDFTGDIDIGWFIMNESATEFVVFDNDANLYRLSDEGEQLKTWQYIDDPDEQLFSVIDGTYVFDEFHILYTVDGQYWINDTEFKGDGTPLALGHDADMLYVEVQVDSELAVYQLDSSLDVQSQFTIPSDSMIPTIRVGRIGLPEIIQSTFEGDIQIFSYDVLVGNYSVENGPAVFGKVNSTVTHFVWSDPDSTYLNLLEFESGENQVIADLNGEYAQYYLLSDDTALVFAVNVDFVPNLYVWDVETGERYNLGAYRMCDRIPDKVELSEDGTALVIGCDTGLDIWRVVDKRETD